MAKCLTAQRRAAASVTFSVHFAWNVWERGWSQETHTGPRHRD